MIAYGSNKDDDGTAQVVSVTCKNGSITINGFG